MDTVELGKCRDCRMEVLDIGKKDNAGLARRYDVTAVPSIVIDGKIKVVGKPAFAWFCGDKFYKMLEKRFPLRARPSYAG